MVPVTNGTGAANAFHVGRIVLVDDLAHDLFQDVFHRHQEGPR